MKKIDCLVIDFQQDFTSPKGSLYVKDGEKAADNFASFLTKHSDKIDDVHATLDSHQRLHIAHPGFWKTRDGSHPNPFTMITLSDFNNGVYRTSLPSLAKVARNYLEQLEKNNRYALVIWPVHCQIGTWGHGLYDSVNNALNHWVDKNFSTVNFVTKGSHPLTEHYSCIVSDVPDPNDPSTQLNVSLLQTLERADILCLSGLALSHCVANTVRDIVNYFNDDNLTKKLVLLEDTTTRVVSPDKNIDQIFEKMTSDFLSEMKQRGMKISNTKDFF